MQTLTVKVFLLPSIVFILIILGIVGVSYSFLLAVCLGILKIIIDSFENIRKGKWSLDYIAFLAMAVSIFATEYAAGAVIALMFTGGEALEAFASMRAYSALKSLSDTIPKNCFVKRGERYEEVPIQKIRDGEVIIVKKQELVPLDGIIISPEKSILNMANLTGEVDAEELGPKTFVKSGAINVGETIALQVVGDFGSSTYHKIARLVDEARKKPTHFVRLTEKANFFFTFTTLIVAGAAYAFSGEIARALAVLVIATPCPLIIAAPAAFISGMSRLARSGVILRKPAALEEIAGAGQIFFDKTGTLTLGEPSLVAIETDPEARLSESDVIKIAAGIEIHSLHPLAKAIVSYAKAKNLSYPIASDVKELVGKGISASIGGTRYNIARAKDSASGITLSLKRIGKEIARLHFADELKAGTGKFLEDLRMRGIGMTVITGDKMENAKEVFRGIDIAIHAEVSPEDKYRFIDEAHKDHKSIVMVGDGLNDAPALARADVGVVFSGSENGASIEAASVVMLDHRIEKLGELFAASYRTVRIAKESVYGGIALSSIGMIFAAFGFIAPVYGAFLQEAIDVAVILNALRALRA